jgi:hypothetical protein
VAEVLKHYDLSQTVVTAHSQGGLVINNALRYLFETGTNTNAVTVNYLESAANRLYTEQLLHQIGGRIGLFTANSFDAVPQIIGANAITDFKPWNFILSIFGAPFLGSPTGPHAAPFIPGAAY